MPARRVRRAPRRRRAVRRVPRGIRGRAGAMFNPQPMFTETFKYGTLLPNAGFLLTANIGSVPQLAQYQGLYQQYRILKAKWILMPTWTGGENQNTAIYNSVSGNFPTFPGVSSAGTTRLVSVIDSSPDQAVPVSEDAVLQENGCRIRFLDKMVTLHAQTVPDLKDANGAQLTLRKKFLNFTASGPNLAHYGVRGWITHPYNIGTGAFNIADSITYTCYCKLTFQLREPR